MANKKVITDFTVVNVLMRFEMELYRILDNIPKKYKFDLQQQLKDAVGAALRLVAKAIDTPPISRELLITKRNMFIEAHSELQFAELRLCQLNRLCAFSDKVKAQLDMQLYDIFGNLDRLVNSLSKDISGSEMQECALTSVPNEIGTPNCGIGGLPNA